MALDTYFVESFVNMRNIFHDKRISFGTKQYRMRSDLALLHWNENLDRPYSSVWFPKLTTRNQGGKCSVAPCTFDYVIHIWSGLISNAMN